MASIYVHFPYCLEKCPYCDFVSYKTAEPDVPHQAYADAVLREADHRPFPGRKIHSVFFGGGTPSLWRPSELVRVLTALKSRYDVAVDAEVTVECNPTSLTAEKLAIYAEGGINRLSIGVQSLQAQELSYLGREHSMDGAVEALQAALRSPVGRVSGDLIFGLPDQPVERGAANASALAELGLKHLSAYQLTIEPGTRFGELARAGRLPLADDGRVAEAFLLVSDTLRARGFEHYEISNYAMPGERSRHNVAYWHGDEYLGLGCGAFGFERRAHGGVRTRNETRPEKYVLGQDGGPAAPLLEEVLSADDLLKERIMLGLRLREGLDLGAAAEDLGVLALTDARKKAIDWLVARDRLVAHGLRLSIPMRQWLFADDTAARLF